MPTRPVPGSSIALGALFAAAFVVGSAELVVVGVLTLVAEDLSVSVADAGLLVTAYALGIAIGGPLLTALTIRVARRALLRLAFTVYVVGNLLAALASSFGLLVLTRVVTGALHGLFIGVALGVAASLVPAERMGRAIAMVLGGIAMSTALGVPIGTLIAQNAGWRATFVVIVLLGVIALVAVVVTVPRTEKSGSVGFRAQAREALAPKVLAVLAAGFLVMGAQFAALTYLTPFLEQVTELGPTGVTVFLLLYGLASAAGTLLGGRAADADANRSLVGGTVTMLIALTVLHYAGSSAPVAAIALVVWGVAGWGLVPALQYRTVTLAGAGGDLAATLPASATTGGIALGAVLGGWGISRFGPETPTLIAAGACLAVLPLVWWTTRLRAPRSAAGGQPADEPVDLPARAPKASS